MMKSKYVRRMFTDYYLKTQKFKYIPLKPVKHCKDKHSSALITSLSQMIDDLQRDVQNNFKIAGRIKCVSRLADKDFLNIIGTDGHHHTFHEIYANCSFSDDSKKTTCEDILMLLTQAYNLEKKNLQISYYSEGPTSPIEADLECRDLWLSLGISSDALIPNKGDAQFYGMDHSGPCGTTSGIYYVSPNGSLQELWNVIFVTHERDDNGQITESSKPFTVSGMLLEPMTAAVQGHTSNYDTDLFYPIIAAIHQNAQCGIPNYEGKFGPGAHVDTAYRKLADHTKTISMCLADDIVPSTNSSLQMLMHEAFSISEKVFMHPSGFLQDLYKCVTETLGEFNPEMQSREYHVSELLGSEEHNYKSNELAMSKDNAYFTPAWFNDEEVFNARISEILDNHRSLDEDVSASEANNSEDYEKKLDIEDKKNIKSTDFLESMDKEYRRNSTKSIAELITQEMLVAIEESKACNRQFIVHFLACSYLMEFVTLTEDIFETSHIPVMLFACCNGVMKIACRVPKPWITPCFDATKWLSQVTPVFNSEIDCSKSEHDLNTFASMMGKKVSLINCEGLVQHGMQEAITYIMINLPQHPEVPDNKRHSLPKRELSKRR